MRRTWLTTTGVIIAIVLVFAVNLVVNNLFHSSRLDLTDNRLFTLSDGTRNIVRSLEEPVTLRLFISQKLVTRLPSINSFANRVKSLLREYERDSNGKVTVRFIDPEPFSEEEDRAVGFGIQGIPLDDAGGTLYFGMVGTNSTDEEEVIPFITSEREEFLEYDVTQLIQRLTTDETPMVGIYSRLPIQGGPLPQAQGVAPGQGGFQPPWMVYEQASQFFTFIDVTESLTKISDDVGVLVLIHPKKLSEEDLYAVDQFVMRGGRLIVFMDPQAEGEIFQPGMQVIGAQRSSDINQLTSKWGVEMVPEKYAADLSRALKVRTSPQHGNEVVDFPVWMMLSDREIDQADTVTSKLGTITLASTGYFKIDPARADSVVSLVTTTERAMELGPEAVGPGNDPRDLVREYTPGGEKLPLAVRIRGSVASAFGDKRPEKVTSDKAHLATSEGDVNIIMVADTDLLQDRYWVQIQEIPGQRIAVPTSGNGRFVINAIDNMLGSSDLISVRNRGSFSRPFTYIQDIRQDAEQKYRRKEKELMDRLQETESRLLALDQAKVADATIMSAEQQAEITRFRDEKLVIRKDLREVRRQLNEDIETVESATKLINVGLVPLLVALVGIVVGVAGLRRRRRVAEATAKRINQATGGSAGQVPTSA